MLLRLTLHDFIGNILEPLSYLLYLVAAILFAKRQRVKGIHLLLLYFSIASALMLTSTILVYFPSSETIWLYHLNALAAVWLLGFYFRGLFHSPLKRNVAVFLVAVVTLYQFLKIVILRQGQLFDSIGYSLLGLSVVIYVLMYFHHLLNNVTEENIFTNFNFWLSSGFLIYFSGSFIIFLTYHYFTAKILSTYTREERYILTSLWGLHNCLLFAGSLMLLFGSLWIIYRRKSVLS